jgi:2-succinyl-6-hydroxy-2,4-cyclohexadiene-1-carboxylate synthase
MIIALSDINLNVKLYPFSGNENFVFLLHGFTGSGKDWDNIIPELHKDFNYVTVDLPGHGGSESPNYPEPYTPESLVKQLQELFTHFTRKKVILLGYSMGGRAALMFSLNKNSRVRGLILEGASAGIEDEKMRKLRKADDENLANFIEKHTIEEFVDHWMNLDIFKSQKNIPKRIAGLRDEKLLNNKIGLSNSLRGFSTGNMPYLFNQLNGLLCKTLLISGELDSKYTRLNADMAKQIPYCNHFIVPDAGHNVHVEKKDIFVSAVNQFLDSF